MKDNLFNTIKLIDELEGNKLVNATQMVRLLGVDVKLTPEQEKQLTKSIVDSVTEYVGKI